MNDGPDIEILDPDGKIPDESMALIIAKSEINQQIATAHAYPRSIERSVKSIMTLATLDAETAASCIYALPRSGKPIKGPSARFAEIVASQWGNNRVAARVVHVDKTEKYVEAEGIFHDLETNMARRALVRRRISDKHGRLLSDDMIIVTGNAAASIASRNAILAGVPRAVWGRAYERCEKVIAGDIKTLAVSIGEAMKAFAAFGVTPEQVCVAIAVPGPADITIDHIALLRGMHATLRNGESTVEEMFPPPPKPTAAGRAAPTPPAETAATAPAATDPAPPAKAEAPVKRSPPKPPAEG